MQHQIRALVLFLLSGSACAMFYPRPKDTPRLSKRSFFTTVNGNHYPRIGRRDATSSLLLPDTDYPDLGGFDKRGVFTQGSYGSYPRVGRSGAVFSRLPSNRHKILEKDGGVEDDSGDGSRQLILGENFGLPLDVMFIAFDINNDGNLSKDEFVSGLQQYHQPCPLY